MHFPVPFWKKNPFIRLLLPFLAGILVEWHYPIPVYFSGITLILSLSIFLSFFSIPIFKRYRFSYASGIASFFLFTAFGALFIKQKNILNNENWFNNFYKDHDVYKVVLLEDPVEKSNSFKANAAVIAVIKQNNQVPVKGGIILYFKKDSSLLQLSEGSILLLAKTLQPVRNAGNPGGFDYERYSLFRGNTSQVFLSNNDFRVIPGEKLNRLQQLIHFTKQSVLNILRKNIRDEKELGLAEALLIGYKDDLDKTLARSYTNTGVVHIIAISGLHLGLIYGLLLLLVKPLHQRKYTKWLAPFIVITGLWLFSLLAGAQASILRSAVMFTCIVLGQNLSRKTSIYNTLALSAFLLLLYQPFWLWDVGFQLSYAAVFSILVFSRPVYNLLYIKNKLFDMIWKLNSVTIAAQVLTIPLSIYHFHQFPNYFLLTNLVAVPLSGFILMGEIMLCIVSFFQPLSGFVGQVISRAISFMNGYIENLEHLPLSVWEGLYITVPQTIFLTCTLILFSRFVLEKSKASVIPALFSLVCFMLLRSYSFIEAGKQEQLIIYNIPKRRAIDIVTGRESYFIGDREILLNDSLRNLYLKPGRQYFRTGLAANGHHNFISGNYITCFNKHILLIDHNISFSISEQRPVIDLIIVSNHSIIKAEELARCFDIKQIVLDSSVPFFQADNWKKNFAVLHIPLHDVNEKGAFVMNL